MGPRSKMSLLMLASLQLATLMLLQGCAPVFSDFQDARLVGPSRVEVTPSFSAVSVSADGETDHVQNNFGGHLAFGIRRGVDFRIGYVRAQPVSDGSGINILGFGPKVAILRDRVALDVPVGFAVDSASSNTWQVHPTVLLTFPVTPHIDLNPSVKALIPFCEGCETMVAVNLGMGLRSESGRWVVRPEVGYCVDPGEDMYYWALGLGLSFCQGAQ
jgi:hypothetical protein